jgi:hypothetical protein
MSTSIEMTTSKTGCSVPQNQPIYQALLDRAASYPADKSYQANAYKKVAESVLTTKNNIYDVCEGYSPLELDSAGDKITEFIYNFVQSNPVATVVTKSIYTPETPRRSRRNVGKTVKYYTDEDELDDIEEALIAFCNKKRLTYSDDLVTEYYQYNKNPSAPYFGKKYNWRTDTYEVRSITEKATWWAKYYSTSLIKQAQDAKLSNAFLKYCTKNNYQFDPIMIQKYNDWVADPTNDKFINTIYRGCMCSQCARTNAGRTQTVPLTTSVRIKNFFSSFKKTLIF